MCQVQWYSKSLKPEIHGKFKIEFVLHREGSALNIRTGRSMMFWK
jgi:hypothetical protein